MPKGRIAMNWLLSVGFYCMRWPVFTSAMIADFRLVVAIWRCKESTWFMFLQIYNTDTQWFIFVLIRNEVKTKNFSFQRPSKLRRRRYGYEKREPPDITVRWLPSIIFLYVSRSMRNPALPISQQGHYRRTCIPVSQMSCKELPLRFSLWLW